MDRSTIKKIIWAVIALYCFVAIIIGFTTGTDLAPAMLLSLPLIFFLIGGLFGFKKSTKDLMIHSERINKLSIFSTAHISFNGQATAPPTIASGTIPYHITLIILAILSIIIVNGDRLLGEGYYTWFVDDLQFQFVSTLLFIILGAINPLIKMPDNFLTAIKDQPLKPENFETQQEAKIRKTEMLEYMADDKKSFLMRSMLSLAFITLFIYTGWLKFPSLSNEHILMTGIDITLLLFVVRNIYMMRTQPILFLKENILLFAKLFTLLKSAIFILVPLIPLTFLILSFVTSKDSDIDPSPILFIAFNMLAVYLEYVLIKGNTDKFKPSQQ